jgi:hypothetical protein
MAKRIRKSERLPEDRPVALGELIHTQVRGAIESSAGHHLRSEGPVTHVSRNGAWTARRLRRRAHLLRRGTVLSRPSTSSSAVTAADPRHWLLVAARRRGCRRPGLG